jgi:hypothetical protein
MPRIRQILMDDISEVSSIHNPCNPNLLMYVATVGKRSIRAVILMKIEHHLKPARCPLNHYDLLDLNFYLTAYLSIS